MAIHKTSYAKPCFRFPALQVSSESGKRTVLAGDLNFVEERALVDTQKEMDGDLGNVPF